MGLIKEKILSNGIPVRYHKIESTVVDTVNRKIVVTVNSYVNENVRNIEKENQERKMQCNELNAFLDANIGAEDEEVIEQIKEKTNQYNELIESIIDTSQFVVDRNAYELEYSTEFSFESIYNQLKQLDDFKDAEDA